MSLIISVDGLELTSSDVLRLKNKLVSGVILFSRNYKSKPQLERLTAAIKDLNQDLFICVDQEGGRIQRFLSGFSTLPAASHWGELFLKDPQQAMSGIETSSKLMISELREVGVDMSLVPCLDLNHGVSEIIGSRSYGADPMLVAQLVEHMVKTLQGEGMPVTGKHFPGHGNVELDSHIDLPVDNRSWEELLATDAFPYKHLSSMLDMIMPAHIVFPQVDTKPVTFSRIWLQEKLRGELGYKGIIMSDDLSMQGAMKFYPDIVDRVNQALLAGCELLLLRNSNAEVDELLSRCDELHDAALAGEKIDSMRRFLPRFQV